MTLDCTITFGATPTVYALQVEELTVNIRRSPLHAAMPGADPVQMDMGYYDPSISIRGILPTVPGSDGTNTIADKNQIEDMVTDDNQSSNTMTLKLPGLSGDAGAATQYVGMISNFSCSLAAGKEQIYWTFNMTFLVKKRT